MGTTYSASDLQMLKNSAQNFGFDNAWIAQILSQYGPEILADCIELARNGLTTAFITEMVQQFGTALIQLVVYLVQQKTNPTPANFNAAPRQMTSQDIAPYVIEVLQQIGSLLKTIEPQIIQFILNLLLTVKKNNN